MTLPQMQHPHRALNPCGATIHIYRHCHARMIEKQGRRTIGRSRHLGDEMIEAGLRPHHHRRVPHQLCGIGTGYCRTTENRQIRLRFGRDRSAQIAHAIEQIKTAVTPHQRNRIVISIA
jgi:hypothetical protein